MAHLGESQVGRPQRVVVQGPTGSGKTTLAKSLATSLGYPYLELDSVFHQENWTPLDVDAFRDVVSTFAEQPQWVSDGNYGVVLDLLWRRADVIVFIDLPKWQVMTRIVKRTLRRAISHAELWNGNRESLRNLISRDPERNIVLWTWNTHARYHETVPNEARVGAPHANVTILRGSAAVNRFVQGYQT